MVEEELAAAAAETEPEPEFRRLELSLALITFSPAAAVLLPPGAFVFSAVTVAAASVSCESFGEAGEKWWKVGRGVNSWICSASGTAAPTSSMASGLNQLLGWKLTRGGGEVG